MNFVNIAWDAESVAGVAIFYSPTSKFRGAIFLILRDNRQAIAKDKSTSPIPAMEINPIGTMKVHFTMPNPLKNSDISGFITRPPTISPMMVEMMIAGINESAVCKISCFVVKPSAFNMP